MNPERKIIHLRPSADEIIKPSELIQITGHQSLTLSARRAISILWHNAHRQGIEEGKDYTVPLADLRTDRKKGNEWIEEAIVLLMQTILTVKLSGNRTRRVQFLGGNDMGDPDRPEGTLTYSFDKRLVEILRDSYIWGKIAMPVLMAFSSKYAVTFYEVIAQWTNLEYKTTEQFTLEEFREMLGVEEGKYPQFGALNKHIIQVAVSEINGLAPFNVMVVPIKTGKRVTHVRVGWWQKNVEELKAAYDEIQRPRVGRKERLAGKVEYVSKPTARVEEQMRKLRLQRPSPDSSSLIEE